MSYDFDKLQTIHCLDCVTIRVPARWRCGPTDDGTGWVCDEAGEETGTLWIYPTRFGMREDATARNINVRGTLEGLARSGDGTPTLWSELCEVAGGHLWHRIFDGEEDGTPLRNYWYTIGRSCEDKAVLVNFNFVQEIARLADPEFAELVEIMDREIRAARIEPFISEAIFEPVQSHQFADQVRLNLPNTMTGARHSKPEEEPNYLFYCSFEPDEIEARMWIASENVVLADEDTREEVSCDPEFYEEAIQRFLTIPADQREIRHVPGGLVVYEISDDVEPDEIDKPPPNATDWRSDPFHRHLWHHFRFAHGKLRRVSFMLMLPFHRAETPILRALIRLLDREIRAAEFPGMRTDRPVEIVDREIRAATTEPGLRTIRCFDAVSLRIPETWQDGPGHTTDDWCCYEPGATATTLWIRVQRFPLPDDPSFDTREAVDDVIERVERSGQLEPALDSSVSAIPGGYTWRRVDDSTEQGERLRNYRRMFWHHGRRHASAISFNFVVPRSAVDDPEARALTELIEREISTAQFHPFSDEPEDQDESTFWPFRRADFGEQFSMVVPAKLAWTEQASGRRHTRSWYGYFEGDEVEARMIVTVSETTVINQLTNGPMKKGDMPDETLMSLLGSGYPLESVERVADGAIAYNVYDDTEIGPDEDQDDWRTHGLHCHVWRYVKIEDGKARLALALLMLPLKRHEAPRLRALVRILGREIRAAEFPGMDREAD